MSRNHTETYFAFEPEDDEEYDDWDEEPQERQGGPYDPESGKIRVLSRKCDTCVFRPGNLMHLREGAFEQLVQANLKDDTVLTCHTTLPYGSYPDAVPAVCRGFYDVHRNDVYPLRMAQGMGAIEEIDPPAARGAA